MRRVAQSMSAFAGDTNMMCRVLLLSIVVLYAGSMQAQAGGRIVSTGICADQWVLAAMPRELIAGVSRLAVRDEFSAYADEARGVAIHNGSAEGIMQLRPDVVITDMYTRRATKRVLERLGVTLIELPSASDLEQGLDVVAQLRDAYPDNALLAQMQLRMRRVLEALPVQEVRMDAVMYRPGGYSPALGSLPNDILQRVGLESLSAKLGMKHVPVLPLEYILFYAPNYLVEDMQVPHVMSKAQEMVRHRAFTQYAKGAKRLSFSMAHWFCLSPKSYDAADAFAADVKEAL